MRHINFFKRIFRKKDTNSLDTAKKIAVGKTISDVSIDSSMQAKERFNLSEKYDRNEIVDQSAMNRVKKKAFSSGDIVKDPYTDNVLFENQLEAKQEFGDENYAEHSAEPDHIVPLEKLHDHFKNNPFMTKSDEKRIANSEDNLVITSRKYNNAKRSRTNTEFVNDKDYLDAKDVHLCNDGREIALQHEKNAKRNVVEKEIGTVAKNVSETFHETGMKGAISAGEMMVASSGIANIVSVINGEKTADEAMHDIAKDGTKAAAIGYLVSGSSTVLSQAFSKSSSELVRTLTNANVSSKIITTVMATYSTLEKYAQGNLTTNQCLLELGEKGSILTTSGYSMAIGQSVIPIPVIGAAIGAMVGAALTSSVYRSMTDGLRKNEEEYQRLQKEIDECNVLIKEEQRYRAELENYLDKYFQEYRYCFSTALNMIDSACITGNVDGAISGANMITRQLGGNVYYDNFDEFVDFINSDDVDVF